MTDPTAIDLDEKRRKLGWVKHGGYTAWNLVVVTEELIAAVEALRERVAKLTIERDLAIAHDRQPYPTLMAYEAVCAARTKWQQRAKAAETHAAELAQILRTILQIIDRTEITGEIRRARDEVKWLVGTALAALPAQALARTTAIRGYFKVIQRKVREHPPSALISQTVDTLATEALAKLDALDPADKTPHKPAGNGD